MKILFHSFALASLLMLLPVAPVQSAEPVRLKPTSPWHAHGESEYCRLGRNFGTGDDLVQLIIEQHEPGDVFTLMLMGKKMRKVVEPTYASIAFGAAAEAERYYYTAGSLGDLPAWIMGNVRLVPLPAQLKELVEKGRWEDVITAPDVTPEREAAVKEIVVGRPLSTPVILETGSMARPFAAMRDCTDQLILGWGLDTDLHRSDYSKPHPTSNPGRWITSNDYPRPMQIQGQTGIVEFRLIVDAAGGVESCHIQMATKPAGFNDVVCDRITARATFTPALDKDGRPMRSYYQNRVRFEF